ncbi:MAG: HhH-GPD family protein [Labilithrix sp.]|nr:HhH-GPD family protein [Labilithrix sp.]
MNKTVRIMPQGDYSLDASARFLCGFTPAAGASAQLDDGRLAIGFLDETRHVPLAVAISQREDDGEVIVEVADAPADVDEAAVATQVARILSLDHDARGLSEVAARDPAVRALLEATPGFRPVCFPSAYEAAVWGVLAQRITMPVAAAIKQRLAIATGSTAVGFGRTYHASPSPERLVELDAFPGLAAEKVARLRAVALAALDGRLDSARLRAMPLADAVAELRTIRGVGPWTAQHIVMRGCGVIDELPSAEPRVLRAIAEAYALGTTPTVADAEAIASTWRPYRMWVSVLMVSNLRKTSAWNAPRRLAS